MVLLISIVLVIFGIALLVNPEGVFHLLMWWRTSSDVEPSEFYLKYLRVGGVILLLVGIASCAANFIH